MKTCKQATKNAAALTSAFDLTQYLSLSAVSLLIAHLWLYACKWVKLSDFYAPYAALINASTFLSGEHIGHLVGCRQGRRDPRGRRCPSSSFCVLSWSILRDWCNM
jgi:hypothetical protein